MAVAIATFIDTSDITSEQIGMAHAVIGPDGKKFYLVENSRGELDGDGNVIEYKVTHHPHFGYQCTCKAGQYGFAHCKNYCWHVRASIACAQEEREAMAEQATLNTPAKTAVGYTDVDEVTLARVLRRSDERKPATKQAPVRSGRAFSLLK